MVSPNDIVEFVLDVIREQKSGEKDFRKQLENPPTKKGRWGTVASQPFNKPYTSLPAKKIFLSEYEVKQLLKKSPKELHIPESAIVSPLAQEWLEQKGVKIVRG